MLHRNWSLYDTAHVVFQPKRMSVEQRADGYQQCYRRIFSHASILAVYAVAMALLESTVVVYMRYLYYASNPLEIFPLQFLSSYDLW